jgi:hypothetical protein
MVFETCLGVASHHISEVVHCDSSTEATRHWRVRHSAPLVLCCVKHLSTTHVCVCLYDFELFTINSWLLLLISKPVEC